MTDSPREEPRPDRLREINWRLVRRYGYTGMNEPFGVSAMDADLKWLVAEVERLREEVSEWKRRRGLAVGLKVGALWASGAGTRQEEPTDG
jgi:hypothetical protein